MHPKSLSIADFIYDLPDERIAHYPLDERDLSKLLIYKQGEISEDIYRNISGHISGNSLMVFNNTSVIPARLFFKNATGAKIEIFCLYPVWSFSSFKEEPMGGDMASAMMQTGIARWNCLIGRAGKWKEKELHLQTDEVTLTAEIISRSADAFVIEFSWQPAHYTFAEILDKTGMMPIPPYLGRESEGIDNLRYQTVYAAEKGSVAAPTAGLHFTPEVMEGLRAKGIGFSFVTLHVGAGTFKPVKADKMEDHEMHAEMIDVRVDAIECLIQALGENIIAVGTTSMRTIESLFWMGYKAQLNPGASIAELEVKQWDPYDLPHQKPGKELTGDSLRALLSWMRKNEVGRMLCKTQIIIAPGYGFRVADAIITNFHQPASTLLLLVAAVVGNNRESWREIYNYALAHQFRFLSYGDGCLLWIEKDEG